MAIMIRRWIGIVVGLDDIRTAAQLLFTAVTAAALFVITSVAVGVGLGLGLRMFLLTH